MRHSKHYWRAFLIIIGGLMTFLIVRAILFPASFGEFGPYRGANVEEQMDKAASFASPGACKDCHANVDAIHRENSHKSVGCQNCHAPLIVHVKDGSVVGDMPINRSPQLCLRCHRKLPSRPTTFPQIATKEHLQRNEDDLEDGACTVCHAPHKPAMR